MATEESKASRKTPSNIPVSMPPARYATAESRYGPTPLDRPPRVPVLTSPPPRVEGSSSRSRGPLRSASPPVPLVRSSSKQSPSTSSPTLHVRADRPPFSAVARARHPSSVVEKPKRNVLRRKNPAIARQKSTTNAASSDRADEAFDHSSMPAYRQAGPASMPERTPELAADSVFGMAPPLIPSSMTTYPQHPQTLDISRHAMEDTSPYWSEDAPYRPPSRDFPQHTPSYPRYTGSPSTRYTDSPSAFSRTSTPTTMSSFTPSVGVTTTVGTTPRRGSVVDDRPNIRSSPRPIGGSTIGSTRQQPEPPASQRAPAKVTSTRIERPKEDVEATDTATHKEERKIKKQPLPPPSPPPRQSSTKFKLNPSTTSEPSSTTPQDEVASMSQPSRIPRTGASPQLGRGNSTRKPSPTGAPRRPSREGAPDLDSSFAASIPIIQSNLTSPLGFSHSRRSSTDAQTTTRQSAVKNVPTYLELATKTEFARSGQSSQAPSREPSPFPRYERKSPMIPLSIPQPPKTGKESPQSRGSSPARGLSSRSTSRLGFFSRRKNTDQDGAPLDKPARLVKRGPAAGTGHEGYGRYATRGRSGSNTSTSGGSWTRSTSNSSGTQSNFSRRDSYTSKGTHELDDFYLDRLDPVIIRGGAKPGDAAPVTRNLPQVSSNQHLVTRRPSVDSVDSGSTQFSISSKGHSELVNHNFEPAKHPDLHSDLESNGEEPAAPAPERVPKQPFHRLRRLAKKRTLRGPPNDEVVILAQPPPVVPTHPIRQAYNQRPTAESSIMKLEDFSEGKEGNWLKPKSKEERSKPPKKWNFFQRAQASSTGPSKPDPTKTPMAEEAALTPAHYTLLDSSEQISSEDLEDLVLEGENVRDEGRSSEVSSSLEQTRDRRRRSSRLLPEKPSFTPSSSSRGSPSRRVLLDSSESLASVSASPKHEASPRPNRLAPIGRIPRVTSTRELRASKQSFSRPFILGASSNASSQSNLATEGVSGPDHRHKEHHDDASIAGPHSESASSADKLNARPSLSTHCSNFSFSNEEFLRFSPRKDSDLSYSSSSGNASLMPSIDIPPPRSSIQREDDIWKEYDDFIDDVLSPDSGVANMDWSPSQDLMTSQQAESIESKASRAAQHGFHRQKPLLPVVPPPQCFPSNATPSSLTESQPSPALKTGVSLDPSVTFSDLLSGYTDDRSTVAGPKALHEGAESSLQSSPSSDGPEQALRRQTSAKSDVTEHDNSGLDAGMNVRFAALMTSRWLSFGQVLFSPAHLEMKQSNGPRGQNRLLVLDGLGNDDWSFYCALTYPDAMVYNLSPSPSPTRRSSRAEDSGHLQSPPNHRQIHHAAVANPFPFPRGFFCAVVFRFPRASSEEEFRTVISECKRVLHPGGYLEISVMDLDMMNMGNRARRALRMLKVRMHVADDTVSLKSASDNVQRFLGRRGFENLNRCTLAVPAAGTLADSRASSIDDSGLSLNELLRDHTQEGDVGITKMVAKVGRWWYSRCHESMILSNDDTSDSIWNDKALLRECEKRETSFKLLICYAQKPLTPKRRTVSV